MRLALLGDPVEHSLSPQIHGAALAAAGIEGSYEARRVDEAGFEEACTLLAAGELDGANVTMPHKRRAFGAAAECSADAAAARAVNTLVMRGGSLYGDNTDVAALRTALESMPEAPVLVLGAGGAASAAVVAAGARPVLVSARRPEAAGAMLAALTSDAEVIAWGEAPSAAAVVNATPLGMGGETLPFGVVGAAVGLIDLAYGRGATPAVAGARHRGVPVVDGRDHLLAQAALSFEIWTGVPAPKAAMARSLEPQDP